MADLKEIGRDKNFPVLKVPKVEETRVLTQAEFEKICRESAEALQATPLLKRLEIELEELDDEQTAYFFRLGLEDIRSLLKGMVEALDRQMIKIMKEKGIRDFEAGPEGRKAVIYLGQEKEQKIRKEAVPKLKKLLTSNADNIKEMAVRSLSDGVSAWKKAKVIEMADTIGWDANDFVSTIWKDKVKVNYVPKWVLEK